jgi:hypothetical protein
VTLALDESGVIEKSCPVPLSATVCGESPALSVKISEPVVDPAAVGSKNTPIEQFDPAATELPQAFRTPKLAGLATTLVMAKAAVPVLLTVTLCGRPLVPTYWAGKARLEGDKLTKEGVLPLPDRLIR